MIARILLFILIIAVIGCGQTFFPGRVVWDQHDYQTVLHTPIDTTDLDFRVYYSNNLSVPFQLLGIVQAPDTQLVMLDTVNVYHPELYTGQTLYFFLYAHWISENINSLPSDTTIGHYFPNDRPLRGYNVDLIDIPITEN